MHVREAAPYHTFCSRIAMRLLCEVLVRLQVHPQATEADIAALLSSYGDVQKVSKVVTLSESGPHAVAHVTFGPGCSVQVRKHVFGSLGSRCHGILGNLGDVWLAMLMLTGCSPILASCGVLSMLRCCCPMHQCHCRI